MKISQYRQRQRCKHVELEKFLQTFASRGFVSDSWAFLFSLQTPNIIDLIQWEYPEILARIGGGVDNTRYLVQ